MKQFVNKNNKEWLQQLSNARQPMHVLKLPNVPSFYVSPKTSNEFLKTEMSGLCYKTQQSRL